MKEQTNEAIQTMLEPGSISIRPYLSTLPADCEYTLIPLLNSDILILFPDFPIPLTPNNMSLVLASLPKSFFDSSSVTLHW
jgi:hypothetical protein